MEPYSEFEYKGCNVRIEYDDDPVNPREEWDNLATMACFHKRYNLGDKHSYRSPSDALYEILNSINPSKQMDEDLDYKLTDEDFVAKYVDRLEKYAFVLPLYLYDHSGITMNTTGFSCPWDSGQVGIIYVTKEQIRKEWKAKRISPKLRALVYQNMVAEVKVYDDFLTNNVFGFSIEREGEEIDSCWGYYGDPEEYLIPEGKTIINNTDN